MGDRSDSSERASAKVIAQLERKNAELERYVVSVTHDLKAPLTTIQALARWVERSVRAGDIEGASRDVRRIAAAADRVQHMVDDLLEHSRGGGVVKEPEDVSLGDLASEVIESLAGAIDEHNATVEIADGLTTVRGHSAGLRAVLQNLVDNAVKFSRHRSRPHVTIGGLELRGERICYVRDNGMGIDAVVGAAIFGLYAKLDADAAGSGVGLALTKRIVEDYGGRVWFESDGTGTTFFFSLPPSRPQTPTPEDDP